MNHILKILKLNYFKCKRLFSKFKMSTWPTRPTIWNKQCLQLLVDGTTNPSTSKSTNLKEIISKSRDFPLKFPVVSILSHNLISKAGNETLERNINSVYPVIHEHCLKLCAEFILFKRKHGSDVEKSLYENMTIVNFIDRLLRKRTANFMDPSDHYMLLDGTTGFGNWESIGTFREKQPLTLANCLSYDEIKLSAFLSVSSYSYFINDGNRYNKGVIQNDRTNLEDEGIIIGIIGTRLEKEEVMEYQEIIISNKQNTPEKGYGRDDSPSLRNLFANFYEEVSYTYKDVRNNDDERFVKLEDGLIFDNVAYAKRLALTFDTLLLEANYRAKIKNTSAYIHVVGIGLGVWKISDHQEKIFLETFAQRLSFFGKILSNVSDVHFAYFSRVSDVIGYKNGDLFPIENHPNRGIKIHISRREPFTKLSDEGKLLVVSYAWDGNTLPGNEFWVGMLSATGDCAAACSTQIAELHNPHINEYYVCGQNLRIATLSGEILFIDQFLDQIKKEE